MSSKKLFRNMITADKLFQNLPEYKQPITEFQPIESSKLRESFFKRPFDLFLSGLGLIFSAPLWVFIWLAIVIEDGFPVLIRQERIGKNGKLFISYKFRSMKKHSLEEKMNPQATEHDLRITKVGRFLRKCAVDELPQLLNIFKGDMSFVGPRALLPVEVEVHAYTNGGTPNITEIPGYAKRITVKPGLTGIAQIWAPRDILRRHKFKYDLLYIRKRNFALDLKLILISLLVTFRGTWEKRKAKLNMLTKSPQVNRPSVLRSRAAYWIPVVIFVAALFPLLMVLNNFVRQWTTFTSIVGIIRFFAPETDIFAIGAILGMARDGVHVLVYAVFSFLLFRGFRGNERRLNMNHFIIPGSIAVCFGMLDEFVIQQILPNRGACFQDFMINVLSVILILLILYRKKRQNTLLRYPRRQAKYINKFAYHWLPVVVYLFGFFLLANVLLTNKNTLHIIDWGMAWFAPEANHATVCMIVGKSRDYSHIIIYAFFTYLIFRGMCRASKVWRTKLAVYTGVVVLAFSVIDEFVQGFLSQRSASFNDWFIDVLGIIVGITVIYIRRHTFSSLSPL
jgi:lipopolysaccharide/colanic/teichoic acid biosynthesis glycosyltransferase/VanZ family protein